MDDFTYSRLKLVYGRDFGMNEGNRYQIDLELMVDSDGDDNLLLSLNMSEDNCGIKKELCIEYLSEKQMLELYFFLKANLADKYSQLL